MSNDVKLSLQRMGLVVSVLTAIAALLGAWVMLPYRMDAAEKRIDALETKLETQRELLVRIDENVKALKERR